MTVKVCANAAPVLGNINDDGTAAGPEPGGPGVGDAVGTGVGVGVALPPGVGVAVGTGLGVDVVAGEGLAVGLELGPADAVGLGEFDGVDVAVPTGVTALALPPDPLHADSPYIVAVRTTTILIDRAL